MVVPARLRNGPLYGDRMFDAVCAINFYQEIGGRSGLTLAERTMADELLMSWGWSDAQAAAILEEADDAGLIECGVSVRTGWLTDKGRRLLHSRG